MHPILFEIPIFGGIKLHTYGLLVAIGFMLGILWISKESRRVGIPHEKLVDLAFYIILVSIFSSRLMHMLVEDPHYFFENPLRFFKVWEGGLVFYGGLIGALLFSVFYLRKHKLSFWKTADVFIIGLSIGLAIGRLGCFSAGCCYGKQAPDGCPIGISFPLNPESLAPAGILLYPTQLMESAGLVLIFFFLLYWRNKKKFDGQVLLLYFFLYGILRFFIEFFRGDLERGFVLGTRWSTSQVVTFVLWGIAFLLWMIRSRSVRSESNHLIN